MVFKDIQRDPDICTNCFRRMRDRSERNYRLEPYWDDSGEGNGEWDVRPVNVEGIEIEINGEKELLGGFEDIVTRRREETYKIPERGGHRGMRTVCKCGFRYVPDRELPDGESWKNRPLRKSTFFDYAEHLEERLQEKGVTFSQDVYYETLDDLKTDPDEQFADDRMFREAIENASAVAMVRENTE